MWRVRCRHGAVSTSSAKRESLPASHPWPWTGQAPPSSSMRRHWAKRASGSGVSNPKRLACHVRAIRTSVRGRAGAPLTGTVGPLVALSTSPLDTAHRALAAKMVPFGGWDMPLSYPAGRLAEHRACRSGAAVFDVSHLGTVRVEGDGAFERLQQMLTNDLRRIAPGRAQYTHLL